MNAATKVEVLRAACCIAGAEGLTVDAERQLVGRLAREIGVGKASLDAMIERAETDPDFHKSHFEILKAEPTETLAILFEVALADGRISAEETTVLRKLATNLEVPQAIFETLLQTARG